MINKRSKLMLFTLTGLLVLFIASSSFSALPGVGENKVAYYVFDCTPVGQDKLPMTDFTDEANIVVVFEGTLWELADSTHYGSTSSYILNINGGPYEYYKQILDDIQTLRSQGIYVLMNVDDAASWSTSTPFTTWDNDGLNYQEFAEFVYDCVIDAGFDGISLDVEHGATDNTYYRNLITELGDYFGPLSSNPNSLIYTGAFYSGGAPGPIFRETSLSQYLNFVMDMAYFQDDATRFAYWANTLGNSKVMIGMSYDYNSQSSAISHAEWHPTPDKAGIMVFAANKVQSYTDNILAALDVSTTSTTTTAATTTTTTSQATLPSPWVNTDIGSPSAEGDASYASGTFTIEGDGSDIWGTSDSFHYVYQSLSGDGEIVARVVSIENTNEWAKAGVMIRETLTGGSKHAMMCISRSNGAAFQRRTTTDGTSTHTAGSSVSAPYWVRLIRSGSTLTGYISSSGSSWSQVGSATISMNTNVYIGLPVTSHSSGVLCTSEVDNVTVTSGGTTTTTTAATTTTTTTSQGGTITIQENATGFCDVDGTIDTNHTGYTGTGFANTTNATGMGIDYSVNVTTAGTYTFTWRYSNGSSTRPAELQAESSTIISNISFTGTADWDTWTTLSGNASLSTGVQSIRLEATGSAGLPNIDYMSISGPGIAVATCGSGKRIANDIDTDLPGSYSLSQNYPNPFNPKTNISFALPEAERVTITIFNLAGEEVVKLVDGYRGAGSHTVIWDGRDSNGHRVVSAIYLYRMQAGEFTDTKKMFLVK